jgi:hypothetical protein
MLLLAVPFFIQFLRTLPFLWRAYQNCCGPCVRPSAHLYAICNSTTAGLIFKKFVTRGVLRVALPRYADVTLCTANHRLKVSLSSYRNCSDRFPPLKGGFTHSMPCLCRAHAVPLPCSALIHTCHAAPLPCSNSTVSFVKVCVVAGNTRTAIPTV